MWHGQNPPRLFPGWANSKDLKLRKLWTDESSSWPGDTVACKSSDKLIDWVFLNDWLIFGMIDYLQILSVGCVQWGFAWRLVQPEEQRQELHWWNVQKDDWNGPVRHPLHQWLWRVLQRGVHHCECPSPFQEYPFAPLIWGLDEDESTWLSCDVNRRLSHLTHGHPSYWAPLCFPGLCKAGEEYERARLVSEFHGNPEPYECLSRSRFAHGKLTSVKGDISLLCYQYADYSFTETLRNFSSGMLVTDQNTIIEGKVGWAHHCIISTLADRNAVYLIKKAKALYIQVRSFVRHQRELMFPGASHSNSPLRTFKGFWLVIMLKFWWTC